MVFFVQALLSSAKQCVKMVLRFFHVSEINPCQKRSIRLLADIRVRLLAEPFSGGIFLKCNKVRELKLKRLVHTSFMCLNTYLECPSCLRHPRTSYEKIGEISYKVGVQRATRSHFEGFFLMQ